jgi:hypothetical protein
MALHGKVLVLKLEGREVGRCGALHESLVNNTFQNYLF